MGTKNLRNRALRPLAMRRPSAERGSLAQPTYADPKPTQVHRATWLSYLLLTRPDHWIKNIFMLPGAAFGLLMVPHAVPNIWGRLVLGVVCACLASAANYVVNEWLDRSFDRFHPSKKHRMSVLHQLRGEIVWVEYAALVLIALALAYQISVYFLCGIALLMIMGVLYNVQPMRTKDRAYLDVLSEAINNPIRLLLGWFLVNSSYLPPSSLLLAYWMGGCFLMTVKRYSELRFIKDPSTAMKYRRSFKFYTPERLLTCSLFYAVHSALFGGVFLIKYRPELLFTFPLCALLFSTYLSIGFKNESAAQHPERLYRERGLMFLLVAFVLSVAACLYWDFPSIHFIQESAPVRLMF